ncbi:MAG: hypothetical protein KF680_00410 [Cryobacterium sp.]|nr:hypothetical protein [Cryobacterium sp.]
MNEEHPRSDWKDSFTQAPYEIDPLTWLSGNRLPLVFTALIILTCSAPIFAAKGSPIEILGQIGALLLMAASCVVVFSFTRPTRGRVTLLRALVPVTMACTATVISAVNIVAPSPLGDLMPIELWWAPLGFSLVLGSLAPFLSATKSLIVGSIAVVVTGACSALAFAAGAWPVVSTVAIGSVPIVLATAGVVTFQSQVVKRVLRWSSNASPAVVTGSLLTERARLAAIQGELATVSSRVTPLLAGIADRAEVTPEDRVHAAELADEIRRELVERSNRSWLDHVADGKPITVVDPDHRAETMDERQRSMVHALVLAVIDSPEVEYPQLLIELRGEADGSTAVAITIDAGLAEGRRIMLLAPHYLSLRTAVDDLRWSGGDTIRMRFRVGPG